MRNQYIYFVVKYAKKHEDKEHNIYYSTCYKDVKMVDIDFSVMPEPNRSTLLKYING